MRAISLTQPWASLVASGAKKIETRSWRNQYRGPLAIHASKTFPKDARRLCFDKNDFWTALGGREGDVGDIVKSLPLGAVIAVCQLAAIVPIRNHMGMDWPQLGLGTTELSKVEFEFGNYEHGRYAWILKDVDTLPEPIPAKGSLGLWDCKVPESLGPWMKEHGHVLH